MIRPRLAALLPRGGLPSRDAAARFDEGARALGMAVHRLAGGAMLATGGPISVGRHAAIAGEVFAPTGEIVTDPLAVRRRPERDGRLPDRGDWGDYIAIAETAAGTGTRVTRSPFGNLPCFWMADRANVLVATSLPMLEAIARAPPAIEWRHVALFLLSPQMRSEWTCLNGVRELPGGSTLEVTRGHVEVRAHWSPWDFACPDEPLATLEDAARVVGAAIDHAVTARCATLENPVLLLSGGLDSSTIAAALAAAGCTFPSLNMVTHHASGDERRYARAVARVTGSVLTVCLRETGTIDWNDATPRRQVRPSIRVFRQPTFNAARGLAQAAGADTIINGGGGDDLFCALQSVAPLLDRYATEGISAGTWRTARDLALRTDVDLVTVLGKAARRRASGRVAFQWPTIPHFLTPDARALAGEAATHPWLDPPPGTLPGQAAHVALVLDTLALSEDDSLDPVMRTVSPLVAQPVVEAVLRVRSWLWFEGGRNRAVVRRAFSGRLPAAVLERTGKGSPVGFIGEIVEAHRAQLRTLLLDGLLVAQNIVDPVAVEASLSGTAIARDEKLGHLLILSDTERWARLRV